MLQSCLVVSVFFLFYFLKIKKSKLKVKTEVKIIMEKRQSCMQHRFVFSFIFFACFFSCYWSVNLTETTNSTVLFDTDFH